MRSIFFFIGCFLGIILAGQFYQEIESSDCELNKNAIFILESVQKDTTLQKMVLDPGYRVRVKQAEKELK